MRPEGFLSIRQVHAGGRKISTQQAVDYGWVTPARKKPAGWGFDREEVPLGPNSFVDNGRQLLAYLFGGRTPASSYVISRFGIGNGGKATNVGFTALETPIQFYDNGVDPELQTTKPITATDFPVPFVVRVEFQLDTTEAVGIIITEFGLFAADADTGLTTLLARNTVVGIPKNADFSPTFLWRLRL